MRSCLEAAVIVILFLLVQGGTWLADKVYPVVIVLFLLTLVVTVFVLLPLAIFRKNTNLTASTMRFAATKAAGNTATHLIVFLKLVTRSAVVDDILAGPWITARV